MVQSYGGILYSHQNYFQRLVNEKMFITDWWVKNVNTKLYSEQDQFCKIYAGMCTYRNAFGRAMKFETEVSSLDGRTKTTFYFFTPVSSKRSIISMYYIWAKNKI